MIVFDFLVVQELHLIRLQNSDEIFNIGAIEHQIRACCQDDDLFRADFEFNRALYLAKTDRPDEVTIICFRCI